MLGAMIGAGASLLGGFLKSRTERDNAAQNIAMQREFAQNGIQWKVNDAKKAGIHPLYALGANTHSFSPVSLGDGMGGAVASAGQDIARAVTATQSPSQRTTAFSQAVQALSVEKMGLENRLLASQIARMSQQPTPAIPSANQRWLLDGQGQTASLDSSLPSVPGVLVQTDPMKRAASDPNNPWSEAGAVSDLGYARTATGYAPLPSKDAKERMEDVTLAEWAWALRNQILPTIGANQNPPNVPPPPGTKWIYNPIKQEYQAMKWRGWKNFGTYY